MPFAGTHYDPHFKDHQDWFVKDESGKPYETKWGGTCLDLTNPEVQEYVRSVADRIVNDWGFRYLKMDGLWTGTGTPLRYVNSGYTDDGIGDAVFHDPAKTNIEAYRDGLKMVRETVGRKTFLLGCNGPQNMRSYGGAMGLVDAMRVGPDNGSDWNKLLRGPEFGSRHYFLHGRVWRHGWPYQGN
jgi:alpha-galactosidase